MRSSLPLRRAGLPDRTFIFFPLFGFSINTLALFGLVLAIGLVVDDAIVVVEAVEHHIGHGLSPRDATLRAMSEVSGPVIGIALVLTALTQVSQTLQTFMGGYFVNYFNRFGRQWQVFVQAEGEYRARAEDVGLFHVRNSNNEMVPLNTVTNVRPSDGPEFTVRFNLYRAAQINVSAAPGYSSLDVMNALEQTLAETMPGEMGYDYSGMSFQENKAQEGVPPALIFGMSVLFVFLILAALYESWTLPFSVLLGTPIAVFGAFAALWARGMEINVYAQVGLVMLIGIAAKNAILIVEFAKLAYERGTPLMDAALEGARLRLRPIIMTSFAFILGCVPLWRASGSGAVARQVMGKVLAACWPRRSSRSFSSP